jgi:hypothetical protein
MAKVEASLPLLAKEGCKEKKKLLKIKTKLAQRFWGVGLANHTPKV